MTSDHADDDCRSSSSTTTSHEEHTLYNFAMRFLSHRGFFFVLRVIRSKKLPVVQQMEHSTFQVLVQFSEHFETQQELPGNPLRVLHQ